MITQTMQPRATGPLVYKYVYRFETSRMVNVSTREKINRYFFTKDENLVQNFQNYARPLTGMFKTRGMIINIHIAIDNDTAGYLQVLTRRELSGFEQCHLAKWAGTIMASEEGVQIMKQFFNKFCTKSLFATSDEPIFFILEH